MAKKNRRAGARSSSSSAIGATQPTTATSAPAEPKRAEVEFVARPFAGLPGESDWVALREIIPAGTARVRTTAEHGARDVTIVSLLPDLVPALRRADGEVLVALQTVGGSGDASRDAANHLLRALELEPSEILRVSERVEPGPRLQDVLEPDAFSAQVTDTFDFWIADDDAESDDAQAADIRAALKSASEQIVPTAEVPVPDVVGAPEAGLGTAYWCRMNGKEFLRWLVPAEDEAVLDALARLHAARESTLEDGTRLIGAFRTCGILVPVWELARGTEADELAAPVAALAERLAPALVSTQPLTASERGARNGLVSRQVRLR